MVQAEKYPSAPIATRGILRPLAWRLAIGIERIRERISDILGGTEADTLGVFRKLMIGQSTPDSPASLLMILGFIHLLTATGIHLYVLSSWIHFFGRNALFSLGFSARRGLMVTRGLVLVTSLFAWLLSGARPGMLRPLIVVGLRSLAKALGIKWRIGAPLFIALSADLGVALALSLSGNPHAWAPGRWIYALAVGGGLLSLGDEENNGESSFFARLKHHLHQHLRLAIASWAFSAVFEAFVTHRFALATPVLSVITLPLYASILYPLALGFSAFATPLKLIATFGNQATQLMADAALAIPSVWVVSLPALGGGIFVATLMTSFEKRLQNSFYTLGILSVLALCAREAQVLLNANPPTVRWQAATVEQLDVGQGDSTLVMNEKGQAGLIDTGSSHTLSDSAWIDLLSSRGITELSWIALTHLDEDHSGGVSRLARLVPIRCVETTQTILETPKANSLKNALQDVGVPLRDWSAGCVPLPTTVLTEKKSKKNGNAIMGALFVPLQNGGGYLSLGDAEKSQELQLLNSAWLAENIEKWGAVELFKAGHHGSKTSNSEALLRRLKPSEVWVSAGVGNRYGHPNAQTLERFSELAIPVFRTDQQGVIHHKTHPAKEFNPRFSPAHKGQTPYLPQSRLNYRTGLERSGVYQKDLDGEGEDRPPLQYEQR